MGFLLEVSWARCVLDLLMIRLLLTFLKDSDYEPSSVGSPSILPMSQNSGGMTFEEEVVGLEDEIAALSNPPSPIKRRPARTSSSRAARGPPPPTNDAAAVVPYAPPVSKILRDDTFRRLGFVIHLALRVLICTSCRCVFMPEEAREHAKDHHGLPAISNADFDAALARNDLVTSDGDIWYPDASSPPIEGILPPVLGYQCTICSAVIGAENTLIQHMTNEHKGKTGTWRQNMQRVFVQNLFSQTTRFKYFIVDPSKQVPVLYTPSAVFARHLLALAAARPKTIQPTADVRCLLAFVASTRWDLVVEGLHPELFSLLLELPKKGEELFPLATLVKAYVLAIENAILPRCPLISLRRIAVKDTIMCSKHFHTPEQVESRERMRNMLVKFICFAIRIRIGQGDGYQVLFNPAQEQALDNLIELLQSGRPLDTDEAMFAVHRLAYSLFDEKITGAEEEMCAYAIERFIIALARCGQSMNWVSLGNLSPQLSIVQWVCRAVVLTGAFFEREQYGSIDE